MPPVKISPLEEEEKKKDHLERTAGHHVHVD